MKIGIIGGTFNPIHIGHLVLATEAMKEYNLDEIWFIPTGMSYMKSQKQIASARDRLAMTELAIAGNERMKCLDIEIKREGYTYTYETLEQLHREYPEHDFFFIFGADCLYTIETWKLPEQIFSQCEIIAAARNGSLIEEMKTKATELEKKYDAKIHLMPFMDLEISSTVLRERLMNGKPVKYLIPDAVIEYISEKKLYKD